MVGDGDGWVQCTCGGKHWGRFGAAGLLLTRPRPPAQPGVEVLLQLRSTWTHHGGTWGLPGGALDSHETAAAGALREAQEEAGATPEFITVVTTLAGADHGDWQYTYVVATAPRSLQVTIGTPESDELRWVPLPEVGLFPLHHALSSDWGRLRELLPDLVREHL